MQEEKKLSLKRVELSLNKFNEVAIPHHLDLLRQHKANIIKYEECGAYARVRAEQTNARRVASQLRSLLTELDSLRKQVRSEDLEKFDKLTKTSRDLTLKAIMDYLETSPLSINRAAAGGGAGEAGGGAGSAVSTDSVGVVSHAQPPPPPPPPSPPSHHPLHAHTQLQVDDTERVVREREAVLAGWCSLQGEVRALHDAWRAVHDAACEHADSVQRLTTSTHLAADSVQHATASLARAERVRAGLWGAGGAAAGLLAGGPVGLLAGAKAGAAVGLAGSLLGYLGARLLGRHRQLQIDDMTTPADKRKDD